jgi:hypothetical protein
MQPFQYRDEVWSSRSGALTDLLGTVMLEGTDNQLAFDKYTATSIRSRGSVAGALLGKSVDGRPDNRREGGAFWFGGGGLTDSL